MPICENPREDFAIARNLIKQKYQQHKVGGPQPQENINEQKGKEENYEYEIIENEEERK